MNFFEGGLRGFPALSSMSNFMDRELHKIGFGSVIMPSNEFAIIFQQAEVIFLT